jgi:hypothetical protein
MSGDDGLQTLFAEQFNPDVGGVEDGQRRLEQVFQPHFTLRHAAVFEQVQRYCACSGDTFLDDQPGMEVFGDFLFLGLELFQAQRVADKLDEVARRPPVGGTQVVLVEIIFRAVQFVGQVDALPFRQRLAGP